MSEVQHARGRASRLTVALAVSAVALSLVTLVAAAPAWALGSVAPTGIDAAADSVSPTDPANNGDPSRTRTSKPPKPTHSAPDTDPPTTPNPKPTDPPGQPTQSATPSAPRAQPAAVTRTTPSEPAVPASDRPGAFAPARVPDAGSQPSIGTVTPGPGGQAAGQDQAGNVAAGWMSYLPGPEYGGKLVLAGLLALFISIAGLVGVAIRRRP
jgi:hypothetical protein